MVYGISGIKESNDNWEEFKMSNIKEQIINPLEMISNILVANGYPENLRVGHITYDNNVNSDYDYQMIRDSSHDGTFLFTQRVINEALLPLVNRSTYCTNTITKEELKDVKGFNYTIGDIKLVTEYRKVNLPIGERMGITDTVYIPVKCEYVF
jgi:hypothetical protein